MIIMIHTSVFRLQLMYFGIFKFQIFLIYLSSLPSKLELNGHVGTDHYSYRLKLLVTTGVVSWLIILHAISILTQSLNTQPAHVPHAYDVYMCIRRNFVHSRV